MAKTEDIGREHTVHGPGWAAMHGGYFSSVKNAAALLKELRKAIRSERPRAVADLGGGTGFILSQLHKSRRRAPRLVNVDMSRKQTRACLLPGIECINSPIQELRRKDLLGNDSGPLLLTMRSVLHYTGGKTQWRTFLRRVRRLCLRGEYFIHQSACFKTESDAKLMDAIFRLLGTKKRYTTDAKLRKIVRECGWEVLSVIPAPELIFTAAEERLRYGMSDRAAEDICKAIKNSAGKSARAASGHDFTGFFKYCVFVCRAR